MAKVTEKKLGEHLEQLPVPLTQDELLEYGQRLAKLQSDLAEHYAREDAVKKDLKAKETAIEAERSRIAGIIRTKAELRDVRVETWARFTEGLMEEIRSDTGEVVMSRELQPGERQLSLEVPPPGRKLKIQDAPEDST